VQSIAAAEKDMGFHPVLWHVQYRLDDILNRKAAPNGFPCTGTSSTTSHQMLLLVEAQIGASPALPDEENTSCKRSCCCIARRGRPPLGTSPRPHRRGSHNTRAASPQFRTWVFVLAKLLLSPTHNTLC
jgi:hypothetical protein